MKAARITISHGVAALCCLAGACLAQGAPGVLDLGSRLELFVDDYLIASMTGATLRLHPPVAREIVMTFTEPADGSGCSYHQTFRDGETFRMYYISQDLTDNSGAMVTRHPCFVCYAESTDGIHWTKPKLGLFDYKGSKENNIVWAGPAVDNFTVFKDPNPACRAGEEYKAVGSGQGGLQAWKSSDALHWSLLRPEAIITKGAFDTQNITFWDAQRGHYWAYIRDFHNGIRDIRVATSPDFLTWTEPEMLKYEDSPDEPLYTNQIEPYFRAPHLFVGFPTRYVERGWEQSFESMPDKPHRQARMKVSGRYGTAVTDGLFMSSRDGRTFRRWGEAIIRPGIERTHNWVYGDGYQTYGLLVTPAADPLAPAELSAYAPENFWKESECLRRYTFRMDGFVSLNAPLKGGDVVTKPLTFAGKELVLNFATSAAGSVKVELQDDAGQPLPGHALADCDDIFGDTIERLVTWKGSADLADLAGKTVRLRFALKDADVWAMKFR
jgi:hypothetical protein